MAQEFSFDVVSKVDLQEVSNAVQQASKEIADPFRFPGSESKIEWNEKELALTLTSDDDAQAEIRRGHPRDPSRQARDRRQVARLQKIEAAASGTVRQVVKIQQGIPSEKAKEIVKAIKDRKLRSRPRSRPTRSGSPGATRTISRRRWPCCGPGTSASRSSSPTTDEPFAWRIRA